MWECIAGKQTIILGLINVFIKFYFRLLVAAMHFNENFRRAQAITKSGKERIQIVFPKQKQGEFTPKIVKVPKTYVTRFARRGLIHAPIQCTDFAITQ